MGGVTANVIGNSTVPVLAIPRSYKWKEPKNILLATNRFERDLKILDPLFRIVGLFNATLHVVIFTDSDTATPDDYLADKTNLDNYYDILNKMNSEVKISSSHLKGSEFEDTLQHYIDKNDIDILAMITYKRNYFETIFHRSATKRMMYRTQTPLLAIPGEAE
jgi:nucleotide-binding universal stress UspA family protein